MLNKKMKSRRKAVPNKAVNFSALFIAIFFILSINLISAQPPFQTSSLAEKSILILSPTPSEHKVGTPFKFNLRALNSSDGRVLTNETTWCSIHIYNPLDGEDIVQDVNMSFDTDDLDFYYDSSANNFTLLSKYDIIYYCEVFPSIENRGGQSIFNFLVTPSGRGGIDNIFFIYLIIAVIYIVTLLAFFQRNAEISTLGGMFMMGLGIYLVQNGIIVYRDWLTNYFSYFTIGLGAAIAIAAAISLVGEE